MEKRSREAQFLIPQPGWAVFHLLAVLSFLVMGLLVSAPLALATERIATPSCDFTLAATVSVDGAPACGLGCARTQVTDLVHNHPLGSCLGCCCSCDATCYAAASACAVTLVFPAVGDPGHFSGADVYRTVASARDAFRPPIA